ncbi:hypothetical protein [uncultured Duncaniella sp.]|uniref:hypothetical protein n=1 Tax=uncultured Duncaniella sp. TaxID=2768039 RepID=UPI0025F349C2|nr:hypothetical protein [uncultured Duncaniella sp.]
MKTKTRVKTRLIAADSVLRGKLMKIFNVGDRAVRNALDWTSDSKLAKKIRYTALKNGGVLLEPSKDDGVFYDADGTMRCYEVNGAVCEFHRTDGSCHIFFKGEEVANYARPISLERIFEIRAEAAALK